MLDSIYHMTSRLRCNLISAVKNVIILSLCTRCCSGRNNVSRKSVNHGWFIDFISLSDATSYDKCSYSILIVFTVVFFFVLFCFVNISSGYIVHMIFANGLSKLI